MKEKMEKIIKSETLEKRKKEIKEQLENLKKKEEELRNSDTFKLLTNTAYLMNMKVFEGWEGFREFIELKHEQHWKGENDSTIEVTFKVNLANSTG